MATYAKTTKALQNPMRSSPSCRHLKSSFLGNPYLDFLVLRGKSKLSPSITHALLPSGPQPRIPRHRLGASLDSKIEDYRHSHASLLLRAIRDKHFKLSSDHSLQLLRVHVVEDRHRVVHFVCQELWEEVSLPLRPWKEAHPERGEFFHDFDQLNKVEFPFLAHSVLAEMYVDATVKGLKSVPWALDEEDVQVILEFSERHCPIWLEHRRELIVDLLVGTDEVDGVGT
jgi:hypothetical protein